MAKDSVTSAGPFSYDDPDVIWEFPKNQENAALFRSTLLDMDTEGMDEEEKSEIESLRKEYEEMLKREKE